MYRYVMAIAAVVALWSTAPAWAGPPGGGADLDAATLEAERARGAIEARGSWADPERSPDAAQLDAGFQAAVDAYGDVIEGWPGTDAEASARLELSGLYAWRRLLPEARAQAEAVVLAFPDTLHAQRALLTVAIVEADNAHDRDAAIAALQRVPKVRTAATIAALPDRAEAGEARDAATSEGAAATAASLDLHALAAAMVIEIEDGRLAEETAAQETLDEDRRIEKKREDMAKRVFVPLPPYRPDPFLQRFGRYLVGVGLLLLIVVFFVRPMPPEHRTEALQGKPAMGCGLFLVIVFVLICLPHCKDRGPDPDEVAEPEETPEPAHAAIGITKAKIIHHQPSGDVEVDLGHAQDWLPVDFVLEWTDPARHRRGDGHRVTVHWDFGDGSTATGESVSHAYATGSAGVRTVTARVECVLNGDAVHATAPALTVHVLTGIKITQIGAEAPPTHHRMSFNDAVQLKGEALPASLPADCDDLIDWHLQFETKWRLERNDADPSLSLPTADWPRHNFGWGRSPLYATIDYSSAISGMDQDGELVHAAGAFLSNTPQVTKFYSATTDENPTADPNWFYYYRDYEGGRDYVYDSTLSTSQTTRAAPGTTRIANNAYTGGNYLTHTTGAALTVNGWSSSFRFLRYFMGVVPHERQHGSGEQSPAGGTTDTDSDWLTNPFETGTSNTNPADADSARGAGAPAFTDDEFYAGGPVEKAGIDAETGRADWAHPGTNWTTP
jgi:hypothetical protein